MPPKGKKPTTPGKKEEKPEAKKPLQEKKPESAPAKAKKEGAPKQASAPSKKKDSAPKPAGAAGAEGGKAKDQGKKRKLNETSQGKSKQGGAGTESKKKKVEKKVEKSGTGSQKTGVAKKPVRKQMSSKARTQKRTFRRRRPGRRGKQEIVVYEGRRYFLLPSGKLRAMLDIKMEENDKMTKVDGFFIRRSDVKALEEFKESIKNSSPATIKRKLRLKLEILRRTLMKDLLKEAKAANKPSLATPKDAGREVQVMTMFKGSWVRKKAVPRLLSYARNKTIKIKAARKEKGTKELTEAEEKTLLRYMRKILQEENLKLRQALLSKRPSLAEKLKPAAKGPKKGEKPAKKPDTGKGKPAQSKGGDEGKKQKHPAKKEKAAN